MNYQPSLLSVDATQRDRAFRPAGVVIAADAETDLGMVALSRGARIAGTLVSSVAGVDVANQVVTLKVGQLPYLQAVTDADGNFDFPELPSDTYTLSAIVIGAYATSQTIQLTSGQQSIDHRIELWQETSVNGQVTFGIEATPLAMGKCFWSRMVNCERRGLMLMACLNFFELAQATIDCSWAPPPHHQLNTSPSLIPPINR